MAIFSTCLHPVVIMRGSSRQCEVPCGSCLTCRQNKRQELSRLLQLEEQNSKYCLFITLTYSNDYLPYIDFRDSSLLCDFDDNPLRFSLGSSRPDPLPNHEIYLSKEGCSSYEYIQKALDRFNAHRHSYMSRFPNRDFSNEIFADDVVPFLYPTDLQLFMKRLRKYIYKYYGEKVRFYAIGEYGTWSCRPHWHILLFFNSSFLRQAFESTIEYPDSTTTKRLECARILLPLWSFGRVTSTPTDGNAYGYVASYVNQPSDFPQILTWIQPQKSYHSLYLGITKDSRDLIKSIKAHDFEAVEKAVVYDRYGSFRDVSVPYSLHSQFVPRFTGSSQLCCKDIYTLVSACSRVRKVINFPSVELYVDSLLKRFNMHYHLEPSELAFVRVASYLFDCCNNNHTLNPLTSLFYACKKFNSLSHSFGMSLYRYISDIYVPYRSYLKLRTLNNLFDELQEDSVSAKQYYLGFGSLSYHNYSSYQSLSLFQSSVSDSLNKAADSVKHHQVSDLIKFDCYGK